MSINVRLHGKRMPNGGKHVMKLRMLLTLIEDELGKVTAPKNREIIAAKVSQTRLAIPEKLNIIHSFQLSQINDKLEKEWGLMKKENGQSINDFLELLDQLINLFSRTD